MEICGLGIDLIEIKRLRDVGERFGERFLTRVYTQREIGYCNSHRDPYAHFAARFCAKEAILKAFGVGWTRIPWLDIEIVNDAYGDPRVNLYGKAEKVFVSMKAQRILLSISHSGSMAIAQAIILKGE
jgi:holo-[acyl-carrier protein] synthase